MEEKVVNTQKEDSIISWFTMLILIAVVVLLAVLSHRVLKLQEYIVEFSEHTEEHLQELSSGEENQNVYTPFSGEINIENSPVKGDLDEAAIIIIEFSDFECPYCAEANDVVDSLLAENHDVVLVHKDYPLPYHAFALDAAVAARCAGEQNKYWEMYELLYLNQSNLSSDALKSNARTLKLDEVMFDKCLENSIFLSEIDADFEEGMNMKIDATPSFVVGTAASPLDNVLEIDGFLVSLNDLTSAVNQLMD